jgi:hypothetical protein
MPIKGRAGTKAGGTIAEAAKAMGRGVRAGTGAATGAVTGAAASASFSLGAGKVEERAAGRACLSSGNLGKGLEGLGTKMRLINDGPSAGGIGAGFALETKAFMEAVKVVAKRGWGNLPAGVMCACCVPEVGAEFLGSPSSSPVDS